MKKLSCQVIFPSMLAHGIERPSVLLNRLRQHLSRFSVELKLDANRSLHTHIIPSYMKRVICKLQRFCVDFGGIEPHSIDAPIPRTHKGMRFPGDDHEKAIAFSHLQYTRERSPFKIRLP